MCVFIIKRIPISELRHQDIVEFRNGQKHQIVSIKDPNLGVSKLGVNVNGVMKAYYYNHKSKAFDNNTLSLTPEWDVVSFTRKIGVLEWASV